MILSALILVSYTCMNGMNETEKVLNGFASVAIPIIALALINMGKNFCYEIKRLLNIFYFILNTFNLEFPFEQLIVITTGFVLGIFFNLRDKITRDAQPHIKKIIISKKKFKFFTFYIYFSFNYLFNFISYNKFI